MRGCRDAARSQLSATVPRSIAVPSATLSWLSTAVALLWLAGLIVLAWRAKRQDAAAQGVP
jgi:hypothetical protein